MDEDIVNELNNFLDFDIAKKDVILTNLIKDDIIKSKSDRTTEVAAGIGTGIGQGSAVRGALEAMARNPELKGELRTNMFIGCALAESSAIYGLMVALILIFGYMG